MPRASLSLYMLDSSVCIAALRDDTQVRRLPPPGRCLLSQITVAELWVGVEKGVQRIQRAAILEDFLSEFICAAFDEAAARAYGDIRAVLERRGKTIGPLDLLIAGHARGLGATMLTGNFREFSRVPALKVLRWR